MDYISPDLLHTLQLDRDTLIQLYRREGYNVKEIQGFLQVQHGIAISERHLYRLLSSWGLQKRSKQSSLADVVDAIRKELEASTQNYGYRMMRRRIFLDHSVLASSETVRQCLQLMDPIGVSARRRHRWRRRIYQSYGPNYAVHIDGWDKLKPYGISIHGAIDGFSRRILWLKACDSNKNPAYIAQFYLNWIKEISGVPRLLCADKGTENSQVRDIHRALRFCHDDENSGMASFRYMVSVHNIRIERFWSFLRTAQGLFWINLLKDMADSGLYQTQNPVHIQCARFVFTPLIQCDLDKLLRDWNQHPIRRIRNTESPNGKPDVLYFQPEAVGTVNYKKDIGLNLNLLGNVSGATEPNCFGCSNDFAIQALTHMLCNGYNIPENYNEALYLFIFLINTFS